MRELADARALVRHLVNAGGILSGAGIVAMMVVMSWEVFCRYVISAPTYWALEVSTYLLVASTSLGLAYTLRTNGHVTVDILVVRMPLSMRLTSTRIVMLLSLAFSVVVFVYGLLEVFSAIRWGDRSLTPLAMPLWIIVSAVPAGAFLLALQSLEFVFVPPEDLGEAEPELAALKAARETGKESGT